MLSSACTLMAAKVSMFDPALTDFLKHAGMATLFFIINLLVYEFIVIIVGAILVLPVAMSKRIPERIADNVMYFVLRTSVVVLCVLMFLWVCDIYRLIPIP